MDKELNPNIPVENFRIKLLELHFEKPLVDYLCSLFSRLEVEVGTLDSFVPFHVELEVW